MLFHAVIYMHGYVGDLVLGSRHDCIQVDGEKHTIDQVPDLVTGAIHTDAAEAKGVIELG